MKKLVVAVVLCSLVIGLAPVADAGIAGKEENLYILGLGLQPALIGESMWRLSAGYQYSSDVSVYGASVSAQPLENLTVSAGVNRYSPDPGDDDMSYDVQAGYQLPVADGLYVGPRVGFTLPQMEAADLYTVEVDLAATYFCPKIEGLSVYGGIGFTHYELETDFGFDDSATDLDASLGCMCFVGPVGVDVRIRYVGQTAFLAGVKIPF